LAYAPGWGIHATLCVEDPLILPAGGPYVHESLSRVDFSQTGQSQGRKEEETMLQIQDARPVTNANLLRNFEKAVLGRLVRYLNRKVLRSKRSHFCCFMLFLLSGRLCEVT